MATHFNFENMINEVTRLDTAVQKGPMMKWQRKAQESGMRLSVSTDQRSNSSSLSPWKPKSAGLLKTPGKTPKTPLSASAFTPKTPGKTPLKGNRMPPKQFSKTPNKKMAKTPGQGQRSEDRFIPNRTSMDMDRSHYAMMNQENLDAELDGADYQKQLADALSKGHNPKEEKILSFKQRVPVSRDASNLRVLYSGSKCTAPKAQNTRFIPQQPERILDAPALLDDYYLNLIDWSSNDQLAVALGDAVFLWNSGTGTITELCETGDPGEYISSVSWIKEGNVLALGTSTGDVALWDVNQQKSIRNMGGHAARVGSLAWNSYILSSGARSGAIHHHDVRVAEHSVGSLLHHTQEVCGLRWCPRGRYLASGGNDNVVNVWEATLGMDVSPLHTLTDHQAAVKALSWCPWQPDLLATGGGTADRHIRFWNAASGAALNAVNTNSQVCSILWCKEHRELITGHGFSQNQLIVWKYPTMSKVAELTGHTSRILSLALSPDGTKVMSAAADETLRIWHCFAVDNQKKAAASKKSGKDNSSLSMMHRGIR